VTAHGAARPLRIGLITGEYPPMQGGVGDYTRTLAHALAERGHTVAVLAAPGAAAEPPLHVSGSVARWGPGLYRTVAAWQREQRLDVVNFQYQTAAYGMSPFIHVLPVFAHVGVPWVTTFHDLRAPYLFPKAGPARTGAVALLARTSRAAVATNSDDEAVLRRWGVRTVVQIAIGSNITTPPPSAEERAAARRAYGWSVHTRAIGYFGLINVSKGLDVLIDAFARVAGRDADARLLVIGGTPGTSDPTNQAEAAAVHARIAAAGLSDRCTFTGFLDEAAAMRALCACDAIALPYRDGASPRRGSLMAALHAERAIITTAPRTPWAIDRAAVLVPPEDAAALADALAHVLGDAHERARLERAAAGLACVYAWPTIAAAFERCFAALLAPAAHPRSSPV
jgi:glycosyltransferase involved in cell wall biosynthesis